MCAHLLRAIFLLSIVLYIFDHLPSNNYQNRASCHCRILPRKIDRLPTLICPFHAFYYPANHPNKLFHPTIYIFLGPVFYYLPSYQYRLSHQTKYIFLLHVFDLFYTILHMLISLARFLYLNRLEDHQPNNPHTYSHLRYNRFHNH